MQNRLFAADTEKDGIPTFEEELESLDRVPSTLYRSLEDAAFRTRQFRDTEFPDQRLDSGLSASLLRAYGLKNLRKEGIDAEQDEFKWTFDRLPFLGISFHYERRHIRVLKGPGGVLPGCGSSIKKRHSMLRFLSPILKGTEWLYPN